MPKQRYIVVWFVFLTAIASVFADYRIFTNFSEYDSEGFLMATVRHYLQGYKLYAEIDSGYGPVYYFYNWTVRTLSGTPVTHDVVRISAMLPWLVTPLICAWYIFRFTHSLGLASVVHLLTFYTLSFFRGEPGHPQELCILLLVSVVAAGQMISQPRRRWLGMVLLGAIPAALCLIKVNIGVFVVLAVSVAFLFHLPRNKLADLAAIAAAAACILLPVVLMKSHLNDSAARVYCVVLTAAAISLIVRLISMKRIASITFQDCWIAAGSFVAVFGGVLLFLKAQGIAFATVLNSLVLSHLRVSVNSRMWYQRTPLEVTWIPWALAGIATAVLIGRNIDTQTRARMSMLFSAGALLGLAFFERHSLLGYIPPFCWLALSPPSEEVRAVQSFPRTLLCGVAILQSLYAYPQAGSQFPFTHVLLIMIAGLCAGDALVSLPIRVRLSPRLAQRVAAVFLLGVVTVYLGLIYKARQEYTSLPPLGLRGAEKIHLDGQQAVAYKWLARNIQEHCDVIFGLPDLLSLNFWTGKEPLTTFNSVAWILYFTPKQQMIMQTALSEHANACIVYNPDLVAFWNSAGGVDVEALPLVRYIREGFKIAGKSGNYHLLIRKERNLNVAQVSE